MMESGRGKMSFRASTGAYTLLCPVKTEENLLHKELSDVKIFLPPHCGDLWYQENLNSNKTLVKKRNHGKSRS